MQKIIPHLWFDKEASVAAEFYSQVFANSRVISKQVLRDTPSGDSEIVSFEVMGFEFMAISAGPYFKVNPSISFMVNFDPSQDPSAQKNLDEVWNKLLPGGKVLMPLQEYPFSKYYGWIEDKFGVSWQLIYTDPQGEPRPAIIPSLLFTQDHYAQAEVATDLYISTFKNAKRGVVARYPGGMEPEKEGTIMFTDFMLEGQWFAAMDSAQPHMFKFNEGVSLLVNCDTQEEIDYFWDRLSAVPEAEQCGWLKDKYGISWQISPTRLNEMMRSGTQEQIDRVTQAFLPMKKMELEVLEKAYRGE